MRTAQGSPRCRFLVTVVHLFFDLDTERPDDGVFEVFQLVGVDDAAKLAQTRLVDGAHLFAERESVRAGCTDSIRNRQHIDFDVNPAGLLVFRGGQIDDLHNSGAGVHRVVGENDGENIRTDLADEATTGTEVR